MIYSFINQKGGVGKTTSSVNISAYLAEAGYRVLLIDLDSQANASHAVGVKTMKNTVYDLITDRVKNVSAVIHETNVERLSIIPSCRNVAGIDIELANIKNDREKILLKKLSSIKSKYDYIIIDCAPSLGTLTINALTASDEVIIPMQCEYLSMLGLSQLMYTVRQTQKYLNPTLKVGGIILTMYDKRSKLTQKVREEIEGYFKGKVFETTIPRNIRLAEAPSFGQPIVTYENTCQGAKAYKALADEFANKLGQNSKAKVS